MNRQRVDQNDPNGAQYEITSPPASEMKQIIVDLLRVDTRTALNSRPAA